MSSPDVIFEIHSGIVLKGQLSMIRDVVLTGRFEGDLRTLGRLTVTSGGTALGTIEAGALTLEPGNNVEARVKITSSGAARNPSSKVKNDPASPSGGKWPLSLKKIKDFALGRS